MKDIEQFARTGLRTLVFAYRDISTSRVSINDENTNEEGEIIDWDLVDVVDIERDLILLGATGVEDKLQENV